MVRTFPKGIILPRTPRVIYGRTSSAVQNPYAAHVARTRTAGPNASWYGNGPTYSYSLSQAGSIVDAFGGPLVATAPNNPASPTPYVDAQSGLPYLGADGADDTLVFGAAQTVAAYTAVFRSPPDQATWSNYGGVIDNYAGGGGPRLCNFNANTTVTNDSVTEGSPRSVRRNGVVKTGPAFDFAPITAWQVTTVYTRSPLASLTLQLASIYGTDSHPYNLRLHLAALLLWPTDPSAAEVQAIEAEFASYYGPLLATNP